VEASNSCAGTLIFGSFFLLSSVKVFFLFFCAPFRFFCLAFYCLFLFLSNWFLFLSSFVFPLLFRHCFIPISLAHVVSSLAYPNLLGTKRLGCCCCCCWKCAGGRPRMPLEVLSLSLPSLFKNTPSHACVSVQIELCTTN
jgi:hypothetical protein